MNLIKPFPLFLFWFSIFAATAGIMTSIATKKIKYMRYGISIFGVFILLNLLVASFNKITITVFHGSVGGTKYSTVFQYPNMKLIVAAAAVIFTLVSLMIRHCFNNHSE